MHRLRTPLPTVRRRLALAPVVLLVMALLWAQLLGLAHSVRHAPGLGHATAHAQAGDAATPAPGLLAHLLAPAADEVECQLYDQLGQGSLPPPTPDLPAWPLPQLQAWPAQVHLRVLACVPFSARAPPVSR